MNKPLNSRQCAFLFVAGFCACFIGSLIASYYRQEAFVNHRGFGMLMYKENYPFIDLLQYVTQLFWEASAVLVAKEYFRKEFRIFFLFSDYAFEIIIVDLGYVILTSPYVMEQSKLQMILVSTAIFLIKYYIFWRKDKRNIRTRYRESKMYKYFNK